MHLGYHELRNMLAKFKEEREKRKAAPAPGTPLPLRRLALELSHPHATVTVITALVMKTGIVIGVTKGMVPLDMSEFPKFKRCGALDIITCTTS